MVFGICNSQLWEVDSYIYAIITVISLSRQFGGGNYHILDRFNITTMCTNEIRLFIYNLSGEVVRVFEACKRETSVHVMAVDKLHIPSIDTDENVSIMVGAKMFGLYATDSHIMILAHVNCYEGGTSTPMLCYTTT